MKNKILGLVGLCKKSGGLTFGFDAVVEKVKKKGRGFILIAKDFSQKSIKNIKEKLNNFDVKVIILEDVFMDDFYLVLKKKTGILLIENSNFKKGIEKLLS